METITISIGTLLYYILSLLVIYCIIYYGIMTDKRERAGDTSLEFIYSLILTPLIAVILFSVIDKIQYYHFIFTL